MVTIAAPSCRLLSSSLIPLLRWNAERLVVDYEGPLPAPINKNEKVAKLKIYFKDDIIGNYDLLASENVKKQNVLTRLISSINFLLWGDV